MSALRRVVLAVWTILVSLSLFFVGFQAFLMSDVWWLLILTVLLPVGAFFGLNAFSKAVRHNRTGARLSLLLIAALHMIPTIHMLAGGFAPTVDGVITAVVALLLVLAA